MNMRERVSSEGLAAHLPGELLVSSSGPSWKDILVQIFSRRHVENSVMVPAVAEPVVVWILSGTVELEERELGGDWTRNRITPGDFLLTMSPTPYELRWRVVGAAPFRPMHVYLTLPLLNRATKEIWGESSGLRPLREISGGRDPVLSVLLEQLRVELAIRRRPSALFVQGIAQSLAAHLVRAYTDTDSSPLWQHSGIPASKLRKVIDLMERQIAEEFQLAAFAKAVGMSEFHFSRLFKRATGYSPLRYFIRQRMTKARGLLRETSRSITEIGLEVGYSSPSHFSYVFRREVGISPRDYRG
jgi:AraC family transcriptional regulator